MMMSEYITCPYCGSPHRKTAKYCTSTGKLLSPGDLNEQKVSAYKQAPLDTQGGTTGKLERYSVINDRFRIIEVIGRGGMSALYQAEDIHLTGKIWAVKEMSEGWITEAEEKMQAVQAFQREALTLAKLDHPNLPKVIDTFSESGKHYLVMEFIDGQTLEEVMKTRTIPFTQEEILPWVLQLCDVLHYLHSQPKPIIFRDLKPNNIMIDQSGQVKLIDFGIIRFFKPGKAQDTMAFGTQGYCAIEALTGQTDARSDLYSLCVVLHEMLTGNDPAAAAFKLPPIRQINPKISREWERIIHRGLEMDRDRRWPDLKSFSEALSQAQTAKRSAVVSPSQMKIPAAGMQETLRTDHPQTTHSSRPTVRLVTAMTRLSSKQLAAAVGVTALIVIFAFWFLTPILVNYSIIWDNIPVVSLVAPLVFAAVPRRWLASIAHACFALAGGTTIIFRLDIGDEHLFRLFIGSIISAGFIEIWLRNLDKVRGRLGEEAWKREVLWFCIMSLIATILLYEITFNLGLNPWLWICSMLMAILGWFLGDMLKEYLKIRNMI